eukprot:COSAG01_NODE_2398_length_7765_cov_29.002087_1_plen_94_part_00
MCSAELIKSEKAIKGNVTRVRRSPLAAAITAAGTHWRTHIAQVADIPNWPKKKAKVKGHQLSQEAVVRRTVHRLLRHGLPATGAGGDDGIAKM